MSITLNNVSYRYKKHISDTIKDISFNVENGEILTILGPNGSGKSTTIKCIIGALKYSGNIFINVENIEKLSRKERSKRICYLPQDTKELCDLSVFDVVLMGKLDSFRIAPSQEIINDVERIINEFHLSKLVNKKYSELSGGERRIVNIAQVLARGGDVLILDEPTANLDIANELEVLELIYSYTKKKKIATIMVLHAINMASRFSDSIVVIKDSKVLKYGTPDSVIGKQTILEAYDVVVDEYISSDGVKNINLIESKKKKEYDF